MTSSKLKSYLEVTTNIAVLLVAIVLLASFGLAYFNKQPTPNLESGLKVGQVLPNIAGLNYRASPKILLIAANTTCKYCAESIPFYNRLIENSKQGESKANIIAIFPENKNTVKAYAEQHQLNIVTMTQVDFNPLNISGTPTLILVDNNGKVINFWFGKLSSDAEQQVLAAMEL